MDSIGNDIVDLKHVDKLRTGHPRFFTKIVSPFELNIFNPEKLCFENFIWLLWSIKESVYKYQKRFLPHLLFSPSKINVCRLNFPAASADLHFQNIDREQTGFDLLNWTAEVVSGTEIFWARSFIGRRFIFTVVRQSQDFSRVFWGVQVINDQSYISQSAGVRKLVLQRLNKVFPGGKNFRVGKTPHGCPVISGNSGVMDIPVSFSHHFHVISYSFSSGISAGIDNTE